jgi:hypothetical protein
MVEKMKTEKHDAIILSSSEEKAVLKMFIEHLKDAPLPEDELFSSLGLFLTSKNLSRILFFYEIYKKIVHSHGIIAESGFAGGKHYR